MDFVEELKWRGLFFDMIPETDKYLLGRKARGYIGFDPTAASLGIGNLVQIIILKHFQNAGHQPIAVLGGATGMIGDPSGKSAERNLQNEEQLAINAANVERQLRQYLDFESTENPAILVNNYDFYKDMNVLDFLRGVGKHLTISYMMAKDSVKSRLESGISYTEFSYQLLQAYDFRMLYKDHDCTVQMGGSDQWGNLTAGVELIRRMDQGEAYAVTSPLVTKADGTKFGKTEKGNIFISAELTSPYEFYQFWINATDEDAKNWIKVFTFLPKEEIEALTAEHEEAPHTRVLQKKLAEEVTVWIHGQQEYDKAIAASQILFGKGTKEQLLQLSADDLIGIFKGVPQFTVAKSELENGVDICELLVEKTGMFPSNSEVRRAIKENSLGVNREKVTDFEAKLSSADLLNDRVILVNRGKKKNFLLLAE